MNLSFLQHHVFAEDMVDHYEFPAKCDIINIGSCKYSLMWFELPTLNQIKFVILVKNSLVTTLGFSLEKHPNHVCKHHFKYQKHTSHLNVIVIS